MHPRGALYSRLQISSDFPKKLSMIMTGIFVSPRPTGSISNSTSIQEWEC